MLFHFVALHHLAGAIQGSRRLVGNFEENYAHDKELCAKIDEAETIDDKKSSSGSFSGLLGKMESGVA